MKEIGILLTAGIAATSFLWADFAGTETEAEQKKEEIWQHIKVNFLSSDGLVRAQDNTTTSESQSYVMLISVFNGDRETFDRTWSWTKENLQVRDDKIFSWLWQDGTIKDINSATDADQDIALALIYAAKTWEDGSYLEEARLILRDIWEKDTKVIEGKRYVTGGNWVLEDQTGATINPSYLAPYAYRIFAKVDPERDWLSLVDSSYDVLYRCSRPRGIPTNWCKIQNDGELLKDFQFGTVNPSHYSYDAIRVPFRVALDYQLFAEERAKEYLSSNSVFYLDWGRGGKIVAEYLRDGRKAVDFESFASYGAQLASFEVLQKITADRIFREKIQQVDLRTLNFFDLAWIWFGLHSYSGSFFRPF